jgi:hypothetical protein
MEVNGHLDFKGVGKLKRPGLMSAEFPSNPSVGEIVLKDKKLFVCVDIVGGLPYWVNLVNELTSHRHDQTIPALEWTITHELNTNFLTVQVYDSNGYQVIPDSINAAVNNQVTVSFSTPMTGTAILTSGDMLGMARPNLAYTETFTSSTTWVVNHNLGYNPNITVIVNGYVVQPSTIEHNSVLQATVTFSSPQAGSVRCV